MKELSDEVIMLAVKNEELQKASVLFDRYHKRLYNFFVKISFDRDLGHDLTQNTFMRMIKYRKTYREGHKFSSWIFQMARNIYADHFRKNKPMYSDFVEVDEIRQKLEAVDEEIIRNEEEKLLYISLYKLKPEQREVLILTRFEEMKYSEVAQVLDTSEANVKVKVHRALAALRNEYLALENI